MPAFGCADLHHRARLSREIRDERLAVWKLPCSCRGVNIVCGFQPLRYPPQHSQRITSNNINILLVFVVVIEWIVRQAKLSFNIVLRTVNDLLSDELVPLDCTIIFLGGNPTI